ncbi:MAG TPA: hypothetical protein VFR08_02285 [Candidatus Angelobacter sp.]|nr:hypothetical protein [Candidatus Angelobacter sp.]
MELSEALKALNGEQLSSVEFVTYYVQLRFNGPCLTVYCQAQLVLHNGQSFAWGQPGFRDALCSLIMRLVHKTEVSAEMLSIIFDNGGVWSVSLRDEDQTGLETLMFNDEQRNLW